MRSIIAVVVVAGAVLGATCATEPRHVDPSASDARPEAAVAADAQRWKARADYEFPRTLPAPEPAPSPTSDSGWCVSYTGWCLEHGDLAEPSDVDRLPVEAWGAIDVNYGGSCGRHLAGEPAGCPGPISGELVWTPDDHRVVARASELLADVYEQRGDTDAAHHARGRADRIYAEADDLEARS